VLSISRDKRCLAASHGGDRNQGIPHEALCSSYEFTARIYRKPYGSSSFSYLNEIGERGTWIATGTPHCGTTMLGWTNVLLSYASPPASGTDVYRVAVTASVGGVNKLVRTMFHHLVIDSNSDF